MAGIGDILMSLLGHKDPKDEIIASALAGNGGGGGGGTDASATPPPVPVPPSPLVSPKQGPTPDSMQSPPDLANMYLKLMEKNQNAAALDSGITTIAAGFAQPDNRAALLQMAANSGQGGASGISMDDILKIQKSQQDQAALVAQRAQLPGLMKQYNLDEATVKYLDATGQLDETISALAKPETEVVEAADKSKKLIDKRTGETIKELSPKVPRATEYVKKGDGSQTLVYSDDKTEVSSGKALTNIEAPVETEIVKAADGSNVLVNKKDGTKIGTVTPAADPETMELERADGSKALIKKSDGSIIKELSKPKIVNEEDKNHLAQINSERAAANKPPMTMEEFLASQKGGVTVNVGPNGVDYGDPPPDMAWKRDKDGKVLLDEDGLPTAGYVKGSPKEIEARDKEKAAADAAEGTSAKEERKTGTRAIVNQDVQRAVNEIEKHKDDWVSGTGLGSLLAGLPKTDAFALSTLLNTVKGNIGFDKLQSMREASKTGAALGPVSDFENRLLQSTEGSLAQGQEPAEIIYNLQRYDALAEAYLNGYKDPKTGKLRHIESQADVDDILKDIEKPPSLKTKAEEDAAAEPTKRGPVKVEKLN